MALMAHSANTISLCYNYNSPSLGNKTQVTKNTRGTQTYNKKNTGWWIRTSQVTKASL